MKLRNIFFAAVFLSVGIAFAVAEEPADEDTLRETTYTFGNSVADEAEETYPLSFNKIAENESGDMPLFECNGLAGTGRNDYTVDYNHDGMSPTFQEPSTPAKAQAPPSPAGRSLSNDNTAAQTTSPDLGKRKSLPVYDFSVSFYDSITDRIGFTALEGRGNPLVFSEVIATETDSPQMPDNKVYSFLSFEKKLFTNEQNGAKILPGGSNIGNKTEENAFFTFSSTIAVPFAALSLILCVGFLIVVFTSSKKKDEDEDDI